MKCSNCGASASGNFCADCGASLGTAACPSCGHKAPAGARFCNQCGAAMAGGSRPSPDSGATAEPRQAGRQNGLWVVGGVVLIGVMLVALYPIYSRQSRNTGPAGVPAVQPATRPPDLRTMTPREAADRLFDRIMRAVEATDTTEIVNFLPMAIAAYERASPLDLDGKYHLSALRREALDYEGALAIAEEALEEDADHLLNLAAAAEASLGLADTVSARAYYQRMLDVWDDETSSGRADYRVHGNLMPILRSSAEALLGG